MPEDINPFQPPATTIAVAPTPEIGDAEATRRAHLRRESAVRSIGTVGLFAAALMGLLLAGHAATTVAAPSSGGNPYLDVVRRERLIAELVGILLIAVPCAVVGRGLRRLRPWARWTALLAAAGASVLLAAKLGLGIFLPFEFFFGEAVTYVGDALWLLIFGSIVSLLIRPSTSPIFRGEYRAVVRRTRAIRCPTSPFAWAVMAYTLAGVAAIAGRIAYARSMMPR